MPSMTPNHPSCNSRRTGGNCSFQTHRTNNSPTPTPRPSRSPCCWAVATGADPLTLGSAEATLSAQHSLLSRALQVLTDPGARAEMAASLDLLLRVIAV